MCHNTQTVLLDISKVFYRVWHVVLFQKILGKFLFLLILVFFKGPYLVLLFSWYSWMIILIMLVVILLFMLMLLLFIVNMIVLLICNNSLGLILNLNLTYETLDMDKSWLFNFIAKKIQLVTFDCPSNSSKKSSFKMLGFFCSFFEWEFLHCLCY